MTRIGNLPEIKAVKMTLNMLKEQGVVKEWELPYEEILTRVTAAVFFLTPTEGTDINEVWKELEIYKNLQYQLNEERKLSQQVWRIRLGSDLA